jgi:hypothetical protein
MNEFCSISIVGFGTLAIALHLSALIKPHRPRRRHPIRYLPPASRPITFSNETRYSPLAENNKQ